MPKKRTRRVVTQLVIKTVCKWCGGQSWDCYHCDGTGDHNYRYKGHITYKEKVVGVIE